MSAIMRTAINCEKLDPETRGQKGRVFMDVSCRRILQSNTRRMDTSMEVVMWLAWLLVSLVLRSVDSVEIPVQFTLQEELQPPVVIGDVPTVANLSALYSANALAEFNYVFLTQDEYVDLFYLDRRSGRLETADTVDRDLLCANQPTCVLTLDIAAQSSSNFEPIIVHIKLLDVNDNAPMFSPDHLTKSISESTKPGLLFPIHPAMDPDSPQNSTVSYRLYDPSGKFYLESRNVSVYGADLQLFLQTPLDREMEDMYELAIIAEDHGNPPQTGSMMIIIEVSDINDHSPEFTRDSYYVMVPEDTPAGTTILNVRAQDPDYGPNGRIVYSLSGRTQSRFGEIFDIHSSTGAISILRELDYEQQRSYGLEVIAQDAGLGSVPVHASVEVSVKDKNDNVPEIILEDPNSRNTPLRSGQLVIPEHTVYPAIVALVSIKDPDGDKNGQVECGVSGGELLQLEEVVDKLYKLAVIADLDRELRDEYNFVIQCHDFGEPQNQRVMDLVLKVADINDHAPVFTQEEYSVTMKETTTLSVFVTQVLATDADAGKNGEIVYLLDSDASGRFHIHPDTGVITTLVPLDRESMQQLRFHVIASDRANKTRMTKILVTINVVDIDDEPPRFIQEPIKFNVTEGGPDRKLVGKVHALDSDLPPYNNFSFYLTSYGGALDKFSINPISGEIYTKKALDREVEDRYELVVIVQSDTVQPVSNTATITISIMDVNDEAPVMDFPMEGDQVRINAGAQIGTVVTQIQAHDDDIGANSRITYLISQGVRTNEFIIDSQTGEILVGADLMDFADQDFRLIVMAKDNGQHPKMTAAILRIHVANYTGPVGDSPDESQGPESVGGLKEEYLVIIICVILATIIVTAVLIVAIIFVRRRTRRPPPEPKPWPGNSSQGAVDPESGPNHLEKVASIPPSSCEPLQSSSPKSVLPGPGSGTLDMILALGEDALSMQMRSSPERDVDSGCADLSNSGSQGSQEDSHEESEGSKRSSKASDASCIQDEIPLLKILGQSNRPALETALVHKDQPDSFSLWLHSQAVSARDTPPSFPYTDCLPRGNGSGRALAFMDTDGSDSELQKTSLKNGNSCKSGKRVHFAEVDSYAPNDSYVPNTDDECSTLDRSDARGCEGDHVETHHGNNQPAPNIISSYSDPLRVNFGEPGNVNCSDQSVQSSGYGSNDSFHGNSKPVTNPGDGYGSGGSTGLRICTDSPHLPCTTQTLFHMHTDSDTSHSLGSLV